MSSSRPAIQRPLARLAVLATGAALVGLLTACTGAPVPVAVGGTTGAETPTPTAETTAVEFYWPVGEGNTWVYTSDLGSGLGTATMTQTMQRVVTDGADIVVTMETATVFDNGTTPDTSTTVDYVFHEDGSLTVPFDSITDSLNSGLSSATGGAEITVTGDDLVWPSPSQFTAGTASTGSITLSTSVNGTSLDIGMQFSLHGAGEERVSVPAGDYDAKKLQQDISLDFMGQKLDMATTSWMAEGVGLIKTSVSNPLTGGTIDQVLVSFTEG